MIALQYSQILKFICIVKIIMFIFHPNWNECVTEFVCNLWKRWLRWITTLCYWVIYGQSKWIILSRKKSKKEFEFFLLKLFGIKQEMAFSNNNFAPIFACSTFVPTFDSANSLSSKKWVEAKKVKYLLDKP